MAGGAGHLVYNGFFVEHSDIDAQDFRPRSNWLDQVANVLKFFKNNDLPFQDMSPGSGMTNNGATVLFKKGSHYVVNVYNQASTFVSLADDAIAYNIMWYDPKDGGDMVAGTIACISGGGDQDIGGPPTNIDSDWVALLSNTRAC